MKTIYFLAFFLCLLFVTAQNKTDLYIEKYSNLAIKEMNMYNIPASITLSQGILESGNGESRLAVEGNNHFGIKCHDNWSGETIIEDDDERNECFRKYARAGDSYRDHSLFLTESKRYSFLFKFKNTDYKKWAKGLKKAGYATNPEYSSLLIKLIEKYGLNKFDSEKYIKERSFYFANSYGLPYLTGLGMYHFKERRVYSIEVNTSFVFSEANIGYHYSLLQRFYMGVNSGVIYRPSKDKKFTPQIAGELAYKKNNILIRSGLQFPVSDLEYRIIPFLKLAYLID